MADLYSSLPADNPQVASASRRTALLLTAVLLEQLAGDGIHQALTMMRLSGALPTRIGALLSNITWQEELPLLLGGWLIDRCWGPRRTMLVGAGLLLASYLGLAVQASAFRAALLADGSVGPGWYLLLAAKGLGRGLLLPGLLFAAVRLDAPLSTRVFTTLLLVRLMKAVAGALLPWLHTLLQEYANWLAVCCGGMAVVAALLMATLAWGRWPANLRPSGPAGSLGQPLGWPLALLVLALGAGTALPYADYPVKFWALLLLFGAGLAYLGWHRRSGGLPWLLLAAGAALLLTALGKGLGYGPNFSGPDAVGTALWWAGLPLGMLLLLQWWARRRADAAAASRRLWRANWLLIGLGLVVLLALEGPRLSTLPSGHLDMAEGPPLALLLEVGSTGLFFVLPILISRQAPAEVLGRSLALSLLLGEVANLLTNQVLQSLYG
jgi:hypothetical protein